MGKNEHKQVATHCPSPPLLPAVAPQTSSAPGRATGNHSERLVSSQAACSSHQTYLLLAGTSGLRQRLNAAGRTPEAGNPSTIWIRRNYVLTRTGVVSPPQSAWHCKLLTVKPENRRVSCVPKTIPLSLWK